MLALIFPEQVCQLRLTLLVDSFMLRMGDGFCRRKGERMRFKITTTNPRLDMVNKHKQVENFLYVLIT